ncbi:MAG: SDR family oxidoreductase [Fluviicoccus sp.]|uniref:SDR family oxidoreductase n=1 Tax=Fluviicoccus sp. TaxID=2003552 RepID=UPI00271CF5B8|nr:SDR family oxidoreductase [Fluviicoccus sp.]MDO8329864.1 SDR family oxidoreductase [Fluviicoccus sp.]
MANVLIIGCGDTGSRLAQILAQAGHAVTGVRRSRAAIPGVAMAQADIIRPFRLDISAPDYVFILLSPDESSREGYERTFLTGLENIRTALESWSPKRVFFVSSTSVYGEENGEWVDEETPPRPKGFNGAVLLQAEALACRFWLTTVVRFAGIYGEGRLRLLKWVESGRPVNPALWSNRIHVADAARLLVFLMEQHLQGRELAEIYLGVDDCPVLQAEVLDWLAGRMGLPAVPRVAADEAGANRRIRNSRIRHLGFDPLYPDYRTGYLSLGYR